MHQEVSVYHTWKVLIIHHEIIHVQDGHTGVADLLLENGANVSAVANGGWTPLHFASMSKC